MSIELDKSSVRRKVLSRKTYPPPLNNLRVLHNCFVGVYVEVPLSEPGPRRIHWISTGVTVLQRGVINVAALSFLGWSPLLS